jgi:hypothetical protein
MFDPITQALLTQTNPWAAGYGIPQAGIGSQFGTQGLQGLGQSGMSQGWPGTQIGNPLFSHMQQGSPFGQQISPFGGTPYGIPQNLTQLLPQTWLGSPYATQFGQNPLMHQYTQHPAYLQLLLHQLWQAQQYSPFGQTGIGGGIGQAGNPLLHQLSQLGQTGFGMGSPLGQIGSPQSYLPPHLLQSLYGVSQGMGQLGRSPFGYGGYPFA